MKVGVKLISGFLVVAAIGGVIGLQGILKSSEINDMAGVMYSRETVGMQAVSEANIQLLAAERSIRNAILSSDANDRAQNLAGLDERLANAKKALQAAEPSFVTDNGKQMVRDAVTALASYQSGLQKVTSLLNAEKTASDRDSVTELNTVVRPLSDKADAPIFRSC
jgi:methyl-accepting chemotaxis protein